MILSRNLKIVFGISLLINNIAFGSQKELQLCNTAQRKQEIAIRKEELTEKALKQYNELCEAVFSNNIYYEEVDCYKEFYGKYDVTSFKNQTTPSCDFIIDKGDNDCVKIHSNSPEGEFEFTQVLDAVLYNSCTFSERAKEVSSHLQALRKVVLDVMKAKGYDYQTLIFFPASNNGFNPVIRWPVDGKVRKILFRVDFSTLVSLGKCLESKRKCTRQQAHDYITYVVLNAFFACNNLKYYCLKYGTNPITRLSIWKEREICTNDEKWKNFLRTVNNINDCAATFLVVLQQGKSFAERCLFRLMHKNQDIKNRTGAFNSVGIERCIHILNALGQVWDVDFEKLYSNRLTYTYLGQNQDIRQVWQEVLRFIKENNFAFPRITLEETASYPNEIVDNNEIVGNSDIIIDLS